MSFTASLAEIVAKNTNGLLGTASSWERVPLQLVASILNGYPFESTRFNSVAGFPLIRIRDLLPGRTETLYDGTYEEAYIVRHGDLLIGMDGDFNSVLWPSDPGLLNQRVCKIGVRSESYDRRFLAYVLPGYLAAINAHTSAITVKHLSSKTIASIPLPLPPLAEQTRIADALDEQFSRLTASAAALRRVRANLKRYRASVLKAACEGRLVLTEAELGRRAELQSVSDSNGSSRGEIDDDHATEPLSLSELPAGWNAAPLRDLVVYGPQNGLYLPKERYGRGIPILRIEDYQAEWSRSADQLRQVNGTSGEITPYMLHVGDLVINRVNSPSHLGKCLVIEDRHTPAVFESNMMRMRLKRCVRPEYVAIYLKSASGRLRLTSDAKWAVNQASINQQDVLAVPIPLPSLAEQDRIVAEVERRFSTLDKMEAEVERGLRRAERLRQSILKRAFEGKLVPQNPSDEPASVLLERIRAAREAQPPPTRSRRRTPAVP